MFTGTAFLIVKMERAEVNIFINNYLFRIKYIQQQPCHSGDVPFAHGDAILSTSRHHPTAGEVGSCSLPGKVPPPTPSSPALCRQDTTLHGAPATEETI